MTRNQFALALALLFSFMSPVSRSAERPALLLIVIERLDAAAQPKYGELETAMARTCARLECPNPYLGIESIEPPVEVWWFNEHTSRAHADQVTRAYAANADLMAALTQLAQKKKGLAETTTNVLVTYRPDWSDGSPWLLGTEPFAVIADRPVGTAAASSGAVFVAPDGRTFTIATARTLAEANSKAATLGRDARVFAVRPEYSLPAAAWVSANPSLWKDR
ncbi:MAG TPA: hypothetical protein VN818_05300 [Gammaproteobacteria bacterium]|nr:hypothetical protein [Gammaproteobacteria bacterium]